MANARMTPERMAERFGEKDIYIALPQVIDPSKERVNKPNVEGVRDYSITLYFAVSGGYGLTEKERELVGRNGPRHHIRSPKFDGTLLLPGIEDIMDDSDRRKDVANWLTKSAHEGINLQVHGEPTISKPKLIMYDQFVSRHPGPMRWDMLVGHVAMNARVWAKYEP